MLWEDNYLAHFGIRGQKWGIRRYQNEDGSLTEEGKKRYNKLFSNAEKAKTEAAKAENKYLKKKSQILKYEKKYTDAKLKADKLEQKKVAFEKRFENWDEILSTKLTVLNRLTKTESSQKLENILKADSSTSNNHGFTEKEWNNMENAFNDAKNEMKKNGSSIIEWSDRNRDKGEKISDYVEAKEKKVLDEWWTKREEVRGDRVAGEKLQMEYAKKIAKDLGFPDNDKTYYWIMDRFIFWDD